MTAKRSLVLLLAALGACSTQPAVGSRFNGPTALAAFRGFTRKDAAAIRDYIAVASSRGDEVRFVDPGDLNAVVSPGSVFPLSVPTASRPLVLASAAMGDERGDVLVAASAGGAGVDGAGPALQLIETWDATNRVAQDVSLTGLTSGSDILCLAGIPASATAPARILVGASGGQLVVIPFTRATDGSGAVAPGTPAVRSLGFDPADIAVSSDGAAIYIASRDAIATDATLGQIFGVARITGDVLTGTLTALAAGPQDPDSVAIPPVRTGAATVAVAVAPSSLPGSLVFERIVGSTNQNGADILSTPTSFVYAALDPASCGLTKPIACGIVTIDPAIATTSAAAGNLASDPVNAAPSLTPDSGPSPAEPQPYRAPMPIPGVPLRIAIAGPPVSGSARINDSLNGTTPLFTIAPGTGQRNTGAVAMVSSSDGHVYWLDLSRWAPPSDVPETRGGVSVTSVTAAATVAAGEYQLGLWQDVDNAPFSTTPPTAAAVKVDAAGILPAIDVWPGFTDADGWTLAYQGPLPSLSSRPGLLVTSSTGSTYAAIQTDSGVVATPIADPSLGVRAGDILELPGVCEVTIAAVLPSTAAELPRSFPGGAVRLNAPGSCGAGQIPAANGSASATVTVRASAMVLSSQKLGYLGRPAISRADVDAASTFSVRWTSANDGPTSANNEDRAIARKARRRFYPSDEPCPIASPNTPEEALASGCYGNGRKRLKDPVAPGPIIRFRVGLVGPNPADPTTFPPRDATILFTTQSGFSQTSRKPVLGGAGPGNVVALDRTAPDPTGKAKPQFAGHENDPVDIFVPYLDDQVMLFSPNQTSSQVTSIR